jgi:ligand-binding SRPBCC domain-containing protein
LSVVGSPEPAGVWSARPEDLLSPDSSLLRALHALEAKRKLFTVSDSIHVNAPIERCFLLSTNVELVAQTLGMEPDLRDLRGADGMLVGGDRLVWRGWKFGLPQMHESLITKYERPEFFQDTMRRGRFKKFQHDHYLTEIDGWTLLVDKLRFSLPLGLGGRLMARHVMVPYISKLLRRRMLLLKRVAESEEWRRYLKEDVAVGVGAASHGVRCRNEGCSSA